MEVLWDEIARESQALNKLYWPSDSKDIAENAMIVFETAASAASKVRNSLNEQLSSYEPLLLVCATAISFVSLWGLKKLFVYDGFIPSHKKKGILQRLRCLPIIRGIVARQLNPVIKDMEKDLKKDFVVMSFRKALPAAAEDEKDIIEEVQSYLNLSDVSWKSGRVSGCIYSSNDIVYDNLLAQVYKMTMKSNHLHADVFSGIRKMEAEIIRWVINIYHGSPECAGSLSTGGTESIVLACKAYRDYAFETKGITKAEMVVPVTAHAAFDKAAEWLRMEIRKVPVDPKTSKVDMRRMRKYINDNTVMLVGSAPGYPHGIVDPIEEISNLGLEYDIPVHVDCCLGGFIMPFLEDAGFDPIICDFRLPGVTSISADTHKYAMAPKGTSVIMYSDKKYHHQQFSAAQDWPGGVYITPTIQGSRVGALVAGCWAAMRYFGYDGYVKACRSIVTEARKIRDAIKNIEGLRLIGDPQAMVVAFTSDNFNIYELNQRMVKRGWHLNPLQYPSGVHICLTAIHVQNEITEPFLSDLEEIAMAMNAEPKKTVSAQAAVYGLAQTIPDRSLVKDLLLNYVDITYSTDDLLQET